MADYRNSATRYIINNIDGSTVSDDPAAPDRIAYEAWLAAGNTPDPFVPPATLAPPGTILPQDLMAQFTADDAAKIMVAVEANAQFWLLWSAMQAQKDPMLVTNARFLAGWNALVQVLTQARMDAIATALGVTIGP